MRRAITPIMLAVLRRQQQADPDAPEPALRLARALTKCGRAQEAASVLRAALARQPDEPNLATALAWLLATLLGRQPPQRTRSRAPGAGCL